MSALNNETAVKTQYASSANLSTRMSIHAKYSTNKQGFGNWITAHYPVSAGMSVLELGCGTGAAWLNQREIIDACSRIILTDFSEGMLAKAKDTLKLYSNIEYAVVDIQHIPYANRSFDLIIANMMLYHVPDMNRGLAEVRRVLKKGGAFYCATFGEHGIMEFLCKALNAYGVEDNANKNFTLQNGKEILKPFFSDVQRLNYEDSLAVTNLDDLIEYIYSLSSMTSLSSVSKEEIREVLGKFVVNGVLNVPKEYGMFCCRKA